MPEEKKNKQQQDLKDEKQIGQEFTDTERHKNEVASSEYTGGGEGKADIQNDRNETGGF